MKVAYLSPFKYNRLNYDGFKKLVQLYTIEELAILVKSVGDMEVEFESKLYVLLPNEEAVSLQSYLRSNGKDFSAWHRSEARLKFQEIVERHSLGFDNKGWEGW